MPEKPTLEYHSFTEIFPLLQGEEYDKLVADIGENGLLEPIWLYDGKIVDGRNRYPGSPSGGPSGRSIYMLAIPRSTTH